MTKKQQKIINILIFALVVFFNPLTVEWAFSNDEETPNLFGAVMIDGEEIINGQVGVDPTLNKIEIFTTTPLTTSQASQLKIIAGNAVGENHKFMVEFNEANDDKKITLVLQKPEYQLRNNTLYAITIPGSSLDFYLVTGMAGSDAKTILTKTTPANGNQQVSSDINQLVFEFAHQIQFMNDAKKYEQVKIETQPISSTIPLEDIADDINNYHINIIENKLVLQVKEDKTIKDLANYTVTIDANTVKLKHTTVPIVNDKVTLEFATGNLLKGTTPINNETGVSRQPLIKLQFKVPVENILDKGKISLTTAEGPYELSGEHIFLSSDKKTLMINITDDSNGLLIRNTPYQLTMAADTLKFTADFGNNRPMNLKFTTIGEGAAPVAVSYASNIGATDNIRSISHTGLTPDGSIYIKFNTAIQLGQFIDKLTAVEMHKIPGAYENKYIYDMAGKKHDAVYNYVYNSANTSIVIDPNYPKENIQIAQVTLTNDHTLLLKPAMPLDYLRQYQLIVRKGLIQDIHGHNLEQDINVTIWTDGEKNTIKPNWIGLDSEIKYSAPVYGPTKPIELLVDREVIPKAGDLQGLKTIKLQEAFDPTKEVIMSTYQLQYYFSGDQKRTKILLYPITNLDYGKQYRLTIPNNVFQGKNRQYIAGMEQEFVVHGNKNGAKGIYNLQNNQLQVTDLLHGEWSFYINGYNFHQDIEKVEVQHSSSGDILTFNKSDIIFMDTTRLEVKIRGSNRQALAKESAAGNYIVRLQFAGQEVISYDQDYLTVSSKGKPKLLTVQPSSAGWHDEKSLFAKEIDGVKRYFLRLTFENIDGTLLFNQSQGLSYLKSASYVRPTGGGAATLIDLEFLNYIDLLRGENNKEFERYINQYIFDNKSNSQEAYLYIPVRLLRPQTTYVADISGDLVYYQGVVEGNNSVRWEFTTMAQPYVEKVLIGSLPEDYDDSEPILLTGDFFYSDTITVKFNEESAGRVNVIEVEGVTYLEVFLPRGRDRLKPGYYDIIIENSTNHSRIIYGALSIVQAGEHVPEDRERVKEEYTEGKVVESVFVSQDTLYLKSRYTDRSFLELDLDELMGEHVLTRKIRYESGSRGIIDNLETKSKWADISLYNLVLAHQQRGQEAEVILGRVEPTQAQILKNRLRGQSVLSEFIQVGGNNFSVNSIKLSIPYHSGDGANLKVLRYDENLRSWYPEFSIIDVINQRAIVSSKNPGIFVVVE